MTGGPSSPRTHGDLRSRINHVDFGPRFVIATCTGTVLNPINSSIIAVALVSIGRDFGVSASATGWLVSALYVATAISQPVMGRLADQLGARRIYLAGLALVAIGGLLGWQGRSLSLLVTARVILGVGTAAGYPAAMAMIRQQSLRLRRDPPRSVLAALATAGQATMALGPPLGGILIALGGWRLTFAVNIPLAALGAVCALAWLPRDEPRRGAWRDLDPPGAVLFALTLSALLVFLMNLADPVWWLLAVSVALTAVLAHWELAARTPFIDVRLLARNGALTRTFLRFGMNMLATYCFLFGWAQWLQQTVGLSAAGTGLLMMPGFVIAAAVAALASRGPRLRPPLLTGTLSLTAASTMLIFLPRTAPLWALLVLSLVFGAQNGFSIGANQAAMYAQAPAEHTGVAAGLLRTSMYLAAIASAGVIGFAFGAQATTTGLHRLAIVLTGTSLALLGCVLLDRDLLHPRPDNPVS